MQGLLTAWSDAGERRERERVVGYLRWLALECAVDPGLTHEEATCRSDWYGDLADAIQAGDHAKEGAT